MKAEAGMCEARLMCVCVRQCLCVCEARLGVCMFIFAVVKYFLRNEN